MSPIVKASLLLFVVEGVKTRQLHDAACLFDLSPSYIRWKMEVIVRTKFTVKYVRYDKLLARKRLDQKKMNIGPYLWG